MEVKRKERIGGEGRLAKVVSCLEEERKEVQTEGGEDRERWERGRRCDSSVN